jgi:Flp pilus assembly protein TadG
MPTKSIRKISERGQSMTETAVFFGLLVLVLLIVFQLAWAIIGFLTISQATREGARYAITDFSLADSSIADFTKNLASTRFSLNSSNATIIVTRVRTNTVGSSVSITSYTSYFPPGLGTDASRFNQALIVQRLNLATPTVQGKDEFVIVEMFYNVNVFIGSYQIPVYSFALMRVVGS